MNYSQSILYASDPGRAFDAALAILATNGFTFIKRDARTLELSGPGMRSTKENPLRGATRITIRHHSGQLQLLAELGGVEFMRRFLTWFPLGLAAILLVTFLIVSAAVWRPVDGLAGGFGKQLSWLIPAVLLPVSPWLFLSPIMVRAIRKKTETALDSLLANVKAMATSGLDAN